VGGGQGAHLAGMNCQKEYIWGRDSLKVLRDGKKLSNELLSDFTGDARARSLWGS